jgi:hypothetical protein
MSVSFRFKKFGTKRFGVEGRAAMFQPDPDLHRLLSVERAERIRADIDRERLRRRGAPRRSLAALELLRTRQQQHSTACGGTS